MENLEHFNKLFAINCNDKTEKKNNGSTELTYLSWCYAWSEVKKLYPNMVFTRVEIEDIEHEMWLPVMDSANKAMKDKPYTYKVKEYKFGKFTGNYIDKFVEPATMFDINKTIMRCLTKNLAMFGLGLYIYAGEDLPENVDNETPKKELLIQDMQKNNILEKFTPDEIKKYLEEVNKSKLSELTIVEASNLLKRKEN